MAFSFVSIPAGLDSCYRGRYNLNWTVFVNLEAIKEFKRYRFGFNVREIPCFQAFIGHSLRHIADICTRHIADVRDSRH